MTENEKPGPFTKEGAKRIVEELLEEGIDIYDEEEEPTP